MAAGRPHDDEEGGVKKADKKGRRGRWVVSCIGSALVSIGGGLMLGWWAWDRSRDRGQGHQMWMVPLGLILLVTPIIACSSVLVSHYIAKD